MADIIFGRVAAPPIVDRYIPDWQNSAWNNLGQRRGIGVCQHSMIGSLRGTDLWFRNDPPRIAQALTDYGIGGSTDGALDGVIYRWNDPYGIRSGWANGGSDGLEGDGPAFVSTMGINAINRDLVSIERSDGGNINTPMSEKQFESICQLTAYHFDKAGVPYYSFPINPHFGIVTHMLHFEFATKACPFDPVRSNIQVIQDRIREIMKAAQLVEDPVSTPGGEPVPEPEPEQPTKPQPVPAWPNGWTDDALDKKFGQVPEIDLRNGPQNMVVKMRSFNPNGTISRMWVQRAVAANITELNRIPVISHIIRSKSKDGVESWTLTVPRSGYPDWVAFKGDRNQTWIWLQ